MTEFMEERSTDFGNFAKGRRGMSHILHFSILALNRKLSLRDSHLSMLETADEGLKYKEILSNTSLELMKETIKVHTNRLSKVRHEAERIIDEIRAKAGEEHSNVLIEQSKGWKEKERRVVQEKKHRKMQSLKMSRSAVSEPTNDANGCGARHDCEAFNELSARLQDIVTTSNDYGIQLDKGLLTTDNMKNNESISLSFIS